MVISAAIVKVFNMGELMNVQRSDVEVGALMFASMGCSNYALKFVNYPFMVLAKSAKVIPVALTGWLRGIYEFKTT
jgi:hypothetical protein